MKKIFTMKRVILIMSLVLIYSFAFMFVKIYAQKSIISSGEPSNAALYTPDDGKDKEMIPEEPSNEDTAEPVEADHDNVPADEPLVDKEFAAMPLMRIAAATSVEDTIDIVTTAKTSETTAPTTTAAPETTTKPAATTTAPTTNPPKTTTSAQTIDPEEEEIIEGDDDLHENMEDEMEEDEAADESVDASEDDILNMTDEELQELLERLGLADSQNSTGSTYPSTHSYMNEMITIYDTTLGRLRTDSAFNLVCEITNYEISESYEPEAIKAQAIAAYTFMKYYEQKGEYAELGTKSNPSSKIIECVQAVDGLAMFYDGAYISSPFSASQGGYSASAENVWGGGQPYLQSVRNDFDYLDTKHYGTVTTYTAEELRNRIESKTDIRLSNNYSEWIRVLSWHDNIYVRQLSIDGHTSAYINGRERTITGYIFRAYVLNIKSTAFTVSYSNGVFTFTTYGYGHGVGLSQIGANLYAKYGGYTFDQILHHYYTGVTIQ